jgi:U32 family peptidase
MSPPRRTEVLAPAGDIEALRAAVAAGADAVYFGLKSFSARARATNVEEDELAQALAHLHAHGKKGYVAVNTLVFDAELPALERAIRAAAAAGVDALIVQDLGVARIARAIAPGLPIHASTQMTCTDAGAVELARELGASRVILARELSLGDVAAIRAESDVELEVFVHGALCVAYSGQCLTSEAIGGRSANRGACAQACRLPYELVVDGELRDTGDRAYLLSPEDLEASQLVERLVELGVASIKIEGRLKGPAYVAATTELYRSAVDAAHAKQPPPDEAQRSRALATFTRGSGPGFLGGIDHQRLVEGRACDHRGIEVGRALGLTRERGKTYLRLALEAPLALGDGVLVEGGREGAGEIGGRIWAIVADGRELTRVEHGEALVWLGPDKRIDTVVPNRRVHKNDDPAIEKAVLAKLASAPARTRLDLVVRAVVGEPLRVEGESADGRLAVVSGEQALEAAQNAHRIEEVLRDKLGRLGETPFELGTLQLHLEGTPLVPASQLNRLRRELVERLGAQASRSWATTEVGVDALLAAAMPPERAPAPAGVYVLCRNLDQARAARRAGADGVWLDFLELVGLGNAVRMLRDEGPGFVGVAPPRIRKPGEEKIDRYLAGLAPDGVLVRGLGALREAGLAGDGVLRIGDFSLNVTNRLTASEVLSRGLSAFTPSFDLDAAQLLALMRTPFGAYAELVVHHPMPLFHMEHCVFARELSSGKDHRDCGRPCDRHQLSLRDRAGMDHPVEADVGCRNTVFHAASQSAASLVAPARDAGVRRFRIELVREDAPTVERTVQAYRALLEGSQSPDELWRSLRTEGRYGVVRGSLRVLGA